MLFALQVDVGWSQVCQTRPITATGVSSSLNQESRILFTQGVGIETTLPTHPYMGVSRNYHVESLDPYIFAGGKH